MSEKRDARISVSSASPTLFPPSPERPILWIVAGPNGSGKSSLYSGSRIAGFDSAVWIINPDLLSLRIHLIEGLDAEAANVQAVVRIEQWLEDSIRAHQTVGVETVLSTDKYRRIVTLAKQLAFEFRLIYVLLDSPDRNVERVKLRVMKGGHDVAEDKIRGRYVRSLEQLPWFLDQADQAWIFDNSTDDPRLIGGKQNEAITVFSEAPPVLKSAIAKIAPG